MADDLRILITGELDLKQTTAEINKQIKKIASSIDNLNLNVNIDTSTLKQLSSQIKQIQNQLNINKEYKLFNVDESRKWYTSIQEAVKEYQKLGSINVSQNIDPATKKIRDFTLEVKKANQEIEKIKFKPVKISDDSVAFQAESVKKIDKTNELRNKALQEEQKIRLVLEKQSQHEQVLRENVLQEEQKLRLAIEKSKQAEAKKTEELQRQIELYKKQSQIKVQNLKTSYGSNLDSKAINEYQDSISKLSVKTPNATSEMQRLSTSLKEIEANAKSSANSIGGNFNNALNKIAQWGTATTLVYGTVSAMHSLISTTIELDSQLTQLKRVMDDDTNFNRIMESSIKLSKELGQTLTTINESLVEFGRAGYSAEKIEEYSKAVVMMMNVSELSAKEATNTVIAGMQVFKDEVRDVEDLISRINQVDNDWATSSKDLALSLMKVGATAKTASVELNRVLADTVAVQMSTRESGNVVGNSLKAIYTNLVTTEKARDALKSINIEYKNLDGSVKSASQLLDELSAAWNYLSEEQQRQVTLAIAGKYHITRLNALLQNASVVTGAYTSALNSQGSAVRENEKYMESLEARINLLASQWQEFIYVLSQSGLKDTIRVVVDSFTSLLKGFTEFTRLTNGLNITIPVAALSLYGLSRAFLAVNAATKTAELGIKGFKMSLGLIGIALLGVEALISTFFTISDTVSQSSEELYNFAEKTNNTANQLTGLIKRYEELKSQSDLSSDSQQELQKVMYEIQRIQPALIESTDDYGKALEVNVGRANEYAKSLKHLSIEQANLTKAILESQNAQLDLDITEAQKKLKQVEIDNQNTLAQVESFRAKYHVQAIEDARAIVTARQEELDQLQQLGKDDLYRQKKVELMDYIRELEVYENSIGKLAQSEYVESKKSLDALVEKKQVNSDWIRQIDQLISGNVEINKSQEVVAASVSMLNEEYGELSENTNETLSAQEQLAKAFKETSDKISPVVGILQDLEEGNQISKSTIAELILKHQELASAFTAEGEIVKDGTKILQDWITQQTSGLVESINLKKADADATIESVTRKINAIIMEAEGINDLNEIYREHIALKTNGNFQPKGLTDEQSRQIDLLNKQKEEAKQASAAYSHLLSLISNGAFGSPRKKKTSSSSKSEYTSLSEDAKKLLEIETRLAEIQTNRQQLSPISKEYRDNLQDEKNLLQEKINLLQKEYDLVSRTQRISGKTNKIGGSPKDSDESFKKANELQQQIIKLQSEISKLSFDEINSSIEEFSEFNQSLDSKLKRVESSMSSLSNTSEEYRKGLEEEIDILVLKQDTLHREADLIREQLANGNLTLAQTEQLTKKLDNLGNEWLELENKIKIKNIAKANSAFEQQQSIIDQLNTNLDHTKSRMSGLTEGSEKYFESLSKQNDMLIAMRSLNEQQIIKTIEEIHLTEEKSARYQELINRLNNLRSAQIGYNNALRENQNIKVQWLNEKWEKDLANELERARDLKDDIMEELNKLIKSGDTKFDLGSVTDKIKSSLNDLKSQFGKAPIDFHFFNKYPNALFGTIGTIEAEIDKYIKNIEGINKKIDGLIRDGNNSDKGLIESIGKEANYASRIKKEIQETNTELAKKRQQYEVIAKVFDDYLQKLETEKNTILESLRNKLEVPVEFDMGQFKDNLVELLSSTGLSIDGINIDLSDATIIGDVSSDIRDIVDDILSDNATLDAITDAFNEQSEILAEQERLRSELIKLEKEGKEQSQEYLDIQKQLEEIDKQAIEARKEMQQLLEKEIEYLSQLREEEKKIREEIQERETLYKQQEKAIDKQIEAAKKLYDEQIKQHRDKIELLDEQIEKEDRLIERTRLLQELEKVKNDKRFVVINKDGKEELTYDKGRAAELEERLADFDRETQRKDKRKQLEDEIDRLEEARDSEISRLEEYQKTLKEAHDKEIAQLNFYLAQNKLLQDKTVYNINQHLTKLELAHNNLIQFEQRRLDKLKAIHEAEVAALEGYVDGLEKQLDRLNEDINSKVDKLEKSLSQSIESWAEGAWLLGLLVRDMKELAEEVSGVPLEDRELAALEESDTMRSINSTREKIADWSARQNTDDTDTPSKSTGGSNPSTTPKTDGGSKKTSGSSLKDAFNNVKNKPKDEPINQGKIIGRRPDGVLMYEVPDHLKILPDNSPNRNKKIGDVPYPSDGIRYLPNWEKHGAASNPSGNDTFYNWDYWKNYTWEDYEQQVLAKNGYRSSPTLPQYPNVSYEKTEPPKKTSQATNKSTSPAPTPPPSSSSSSKSGSFSSYDLKRDESSGVSTLTYNGEVLPGSWAGNYDPRYLELYEKVAKRRAELYTKLIVDGDKSVIPEIRHLDSTSSRGYKEDDKQYEALIGNIKHLEFIIDMDRKHLSNKKYHDGGFVGDKAPSRTALLAHRVFNGTIGSEQDVTSLVGELQIPPKNLLTRFPENMKKIMSYVTGGQTAQVVSNDQHYHITVEKVVANNPMEFLKGINRIVNSHKI